MSTSVPAAIVPPAVASPPLPVGPVPFDDGFDARWDAWRIRGFEQERTFTQRLVWVAAGGAVVVLLVLGYLLVR